MSIAKWVWLAPLLLAAYALAYVSWIPPHAKLMPAHPLNATHFISYVNYTTIYIAQMGLSFHGSPAEEQAVMQYLHSQCKYVAVDVYDVWETAYGALWLADIYCSSDGSVWLWLRWLPLRFAAYSGYVEFANATNTTVTTPVGVFRCRVPAGWYLDPLTKTVFRLPQFNVSLLAEVHRLNAALQQLRIELQKSEANMSQAAALIAQLKAQVEALDAQRRALEEALRRRESEVAALQTNLRAAQAENERLRSQLAQLKTENDQLKAKLASMNQTLASLNDQLASLQAQLAAQLSTSEEEGPSPLMYVLFAALAGVITALVIYRKKKAEE
jgi:chaperonin cofactor prefoldin